MRDGESATKVLKNRIPGYAGEEGRGPLSRPPKFPLPPYFFCSLNYFLETRFLLFENSSRQSLFANRFTPKGILFPFSRDSIIYSRKF